MAEFPNRQRCRFYINVIIKEVREFVRMLSQFFRRILGMGVRKEDQYCDDEISSCESQYALPNLTESLPKTIGTNAQLTYFNFEAQQFDDINECFVKNRIDLCGGEANSESGDEANSSTLVNFDLPEIEARAGNELSEFSGIEVLDEKEEFKEKASTSLDSQDISPRQYPLPDSSSSEDSIPEWNWGRFPEEYPQDILKIYFEMLENAKGDPNLARHPAFQSPESFEAYRKIIEAQYKAFLQSEKDSSNRTAAESVKSEKSSAGSTPKCARKYSSDEKLENESTTKEVCEEEVKIELSHSDLYKVSDSPEVSICPRKVKDVRCDEDSKNICCSCRKDFNLMPVGAHIEELPTEDEMFEEIREMRRQRELLSKNDISLNESDLPNDEANFSNDKIFLQVMPELQFQPKKPPPCIRLPSFQFKSEVRTKDKYTTTLENYESLSACKLLKCKPGRFLHDYGVDIDVEIRTLRGKTRPVMAILDRSLGPDFDLSCLYTEPNQVFLYDAPSAFERAAYRMDDHIVPGQGLRKKISPTETAKPKVKRRGIPNKQLKKQTRGKDYMVGYEEKETEGLLEAPPEEKEEAEAETTGPEGKAKRLSPQMDFRHFEGVPVAVVQKKKGAQDDVVMQYAVTKRKKNKNKKKNQKEVQNKEGEKLKNMLLGFDHGERPRGRVRHN